MFPGRGKECFVKLAVALLADSAIANPKDGKLYVLGGGIDTVQFDRFPAQLPAFSLAIKIEFSPSECGRAHTLEIHPVDDDGKAIAPPLSHQFTQHRNDVDPTLPSSMQAVINFQQLPLTKPSQNAFSIVLDGKEIDSLPLRVVQATALAT
jgi:hypothetical protein